MSLSMPLSYRRSSTPHARLHARSERRRRLLQVQETMQGDLIALGYFYAELKVGTPPQAFSLIVDTGSSVTAIPCAGCRQCGQHTNPRFEPDSSFTFQHAPCGGPLYCTSCSRGVCGYRVSYQEGSSYSGFLARDVIRIGVGGACVALERFPFGCSTEETGLFTSQQADGIMGLASSRRHADQSNPTVLEALVERRLVEDVFSLCIGAMRGTLTFGMPQLAPPPPGGGPAEQPPSLFWTRVVESTYYGVEVTGVMLGAQQLGRHHLAVPSSSIVDSGTTFMYLHSAAFAPLLASMRAKKCAGLVRSAAPKDEFCVRVSDARLRLGRSATLRGSGAGALFDECFDEVQVVLAGGAIRMAPSQYFYASEDADEFCLGIFDNYEDSLVIGAINMMDHEVIFDRVGRRIGFYPRECAAAAASSSSVSLPSASASVSAATAALGLANLTGVAGAALANVSFDPCGDFPEPGALSRLVAKSLQTLRHRSPLTDAVGMLMLVLAGVLLGFCCLDAYRRRQAWRSQLANGARATQHHWRSVRLAGFDGGEGAELLRVATESGGRNGGGGGGGGEPLTPPYAQPTDEALPHEGALPVSDEDETSSEHCLIAR